MDEDKKYTCLAEYFADYPEDEDTFYDDMAEMHNDEPVDYPENW